MASRSRTISDPVKPVLLAALRAQLAEGEHLAWAAAPEPEREGPVSRKLDAVVIVGGGYAVIGACVMALRTGQWLWLSIPIGLFTIGLGIYALARAFKTRARKAVEGTIYGFSTRRALIVRTFPALSVRALPIETITDVTILEASDDVGDLGLHTTSAAEPLRFQRVSDLESARTQLMRVIRNPKEIEQQITAAETYALQMRQLMVRSMPG